MGRKHQTVEEKEKRVAEILSAGKSVLLEKGYFHTVMGDIAEKAGISRRTLYLYFDSKDRILYEIVYRSCISLKNMVLESTAASKSGYRRLMDLKKGYINFFEDHFSDFYFSQFFDFGLNTNSFSDIEIESYFEIIDQIVKQVESCLLAGMDDGSIKVTIVNAKKTALTIVNIIHASMQKLTIRRGFIEDETHYSSFELIHETFEVVFQRIR